MDDPAGAGVLAALQDAILPKGLPVPQGVRMAARYLLAEDESGAGGDWFDAIPLSEGRLVLVVGDVVGHGVEASVVMAELKTVFDGEVRADGDVVAALQLLDDRSHRVRESRSATVCACVLDQRTREVTYCTAGHPPPVVVTGDGASYLPTSGAGPLGSGRSFGTATHQLGEGDVLLLYSDGLVERPGRAPTQGTVELLRAAETSVRGREHAGEELVDRVSRQVLERLTRSSGYADDITILVIQLVAPTPPLVLRLPAVADTVRAVRADLAGWLAGLPVGGLDRAAVQHAVGELVSNVVAHAYDEVDVRNPVDVEVRLTPDGVVEVSVCDLGQWRPPVKGDGGRGLALASGFLDDLAVEHDGAGTRVHGRCRVSRPTALLRGRSVRPADAPPAVAGLGIDDDVLHLVGSLDSSTAEEIRHACARASRGGTRCVTINLTEVDLLSSGAVQALFDTRDAGPIDVVAPMGSPAQHVLDLVHLAYRS